MNAPDKIHVLNQSVSLLQLGDGFRTSIDSVLLAASCPVARADQIVLDMGCGVGSALFCYLHRVPNCKATGLDWDEEALSLAQKNAELNDVAARVSFVNSDVRQYEAAQPAERFDLIICNPPYLESGTHLSSPSDQKAMAHGHQDEDISLKDWVDAAFRLLKPKGSVTFIHRADSITPLIQIMGRRFGAFEIFPLWPKEGREAKRVILRAMKDRKTPTVMHAGLVLHDEEGQYTPAAEKVLREAQPLF